MRPSRLSKPTILLAILGLCGPVVSLGQSATGPDAPRDYPYQPVSEATWQNPENLRWMTRNFSIKPSLMLPRGSLLVPLPYRIDSDFENRKLHLPGYPNVVQLGSFLQAADIDGYIVVKSGAILYERYFNDFDEHSHHSWFSSAKSLIGMAMGILVEEGRVDVERTPAEYLVPLAGSAFGQVTIRQMLDMTSALAYTHDPDALEPGHFRFEYFSRAGMFPPFQIFQETLEPASSKTVRGVRGLMPMLEANPSLSAGHTFEYQNINVDVAGWLIEEVSGVPLHMFLRDNIWAKLGTEHDAFMPTDPNYTALAAGGLSSTLRDAARFGLCIVNDGKVGGKQVIPKSWIQKTYQYSKADAAQFANHLKTDARDVSVFGTVKAYRNFWYILDKDQGAMASRGYLGQSIYVNSEKNIVIAYFASVPQMQKPADVEHLMFLSHALANQL